MLFWIPWINKHVITEDNNKFITTNMRNPMPQFDNIIWACIDEIIRIDFHSDLPSNAKCWCGIWTNDMIRISRLLYGNESERNDDK